MPLESTACRDAVSEASPRHCPAMDCSVAMSTFTDPPPGPGSLPGPATLRRRSRTGRAPSTGEHVVHRWPTAVPGPDPRPHHRPVIAPPPPDRAPVRATRRWTLRGLEGTVDIDVTAPADPRLGDVLAALRNAVRLPVPGLWSGSRRLPEELPLTAPELA